MKSLKVTSFGPIGESDIKFGDLTILIGPQASGKSVFLQLLKLIEDKKNIRRVLETSGFVFGDDIKEVIDSFFGEDMNSLWSDKTRVIYDGRQIEEKYFAPKQKESYKNEEEHLFYIPAQRIIAIQNGWPRNFGSYEESDPYVLRRFSELIRVYLDSGMKQDAKWEDGRLFPRQNRLTEGLRRIITSAIFSKGEVVVDTLKRKRFKQNIDGNSIPFMTWSAGQKEFLPLLLSFYYLCPPARTSTKDEIKTVVLEEPEMGLHPQAIAAILLQVIDLLDRGYKVIVSTHSSILLEFAWLVKYLQTHNANPNELYKIFPFLKKHTSTNKIFGSLIHNKVIQTYYFDRTESGVVARDISDLDPNSERLGEANWGGLSDFASSALDLVTSISSKYE